MFILGLFLDVTFSKNLMMCGGLTVAGYQAPKAAFSLPPAAGQRRENITKGSWVQDWDRPLIKYHYGQNRLKLEILIEFITTISEQDNKK